MRRITDGRASLPVAAGRRRLLAIAILPSMLLLLSLHAGAADEAHGLADAVAVLEKERSAAEQYAVVLATVGRRDSDRYVRGIQFYADAKAEFDGLIAALRIDLVAGNDPAKSPRFATALQAAARKRIAFTDFVGNEVVEKAEGAKAGLPDVVKVVPDLVKAITDAGLAIWNAFSKASKERRDAILVEIDHLRWRAFADLVPKAGN